MTGFRCGAATDVGRVRSVNQDNLLAMTSFFAVADGMGGHRGGEVASRIAVDTLAADLDGVSDVEVHVAAVRAANEAILHSAATDPDLYGMGTTLCTLGLTEIDGTEQLVITNVGDSRVYRYVDDHLEQITLDHSLVEDLLRQGRLSPEEAEDHPQRNVLTRALGVAHDVEVDHFVLPVVHGDRFLLCSDGLFNEVSEPDIASMLGAVESPDDAAQELVDAANRAQSRDNITVVVVDVDMTVETVSGGPPPSGLGEHHREPTDEHPAVTATLVADEPADPDDAADEADADGDGADQRRPWWRRMLGRGSD